MNPVELEQQRVRYVRITNGLPFPFTDRHDGVPITIQPGKSENLPLDMAAHIFGYQPGVDPEFMFRYVAKRQGWNTPEYVKVGDSGKQKAREYFDQLTIEPVAYKLVPVEEPDPRKPVPAEQNIPEPSEGLMRDRPRQSRRPPQKSA